MLRETIDNLRQWLYYPQEFRIGASQYLGLSESFEALADLAQGTAASSRTKPKTEEGLLDMAADVGTLVWRIQQRLAAMGELPKPLQKLSRDVERTWDALTQGGIEIKDHTGGEYEGGMALRVITSQPVSGLGRRQIIETLKPTIYYRNRIIQMGEVVVGIPEGTDASKPTDDKA
ncbi:MAG: hypothetical protein OEW48_11145 [Phycisphaerae bacterium]|nr:hypothetical protein [Phycisphaerae bacterium]